MRISWYQAASCMAVVLAVAGLSPSAAVAADGPVGEWSILVDAAGQETSATLTIVEKDGEYSGTSSSDQGVADLSNIKYDNGELSFTIDIPGAGMTASFTGTIDGDSLVGKFDIPDMGIEMTTTGTRGGGAPAIVGTWKLMVDSQLGINARTLVVNDDLSGTYGGGDFSEFAISNLEVDGNAVQFDVTLAVQGQSLPSKVTLTLDGNKVKGKLDFGQGEASIVGEKEASSIGDAIDPARKVVLGSVEWVDLARTVLEELVAEHGEPGKSFSACEVFTDAPEGLAGPDPTTAAWHFRIVGKTVTVGVGEIEGADLNVRAPYALVLPAAKKVYTPEMIAAARASRPQAEAGENAAPEYLVELHNRLAVLTE